MFSKAGSKIVRGDAATEQKMYHLAAYLAPFTIATSTYFNTFVHETYPSFTCAIFRCLPVSALVVFVLLCRRRGTAAASATYSARIVAGLCCSVVGDALLTWRHGSATFLGGMAAFGAAQAVYGVAFGARPARAPAVAAIPLLALSFAVYAYLYPNIHGIFAPAVFAYMILIDLMVWRAATRLWRDGAWTWPRAAAAAGAALFFVSDLCIAVNKFKFELPHAQHVVMGTYYAAQLGIAVSVLDANA